LFVVIVVVLVYSAIRMLPRFLAGFMAYLSPTQVKQAIDEGERLCLLDVRTPAEFATEPGHIPGATNVPLPELKARLERDVALRQYRDSLVITVCRTDTRAAFAAWVLKRHGFTRPRVMSGGMSAWADDGFPITRDATFGSGNSHR
jgi:rhodanese-related sulfurtransferase